MWKWVVAVVVAVVCAGPVTATSAHAYSLRKYNCSFEHGVSGFVQDYVIHNGRHVLRALWAVVPKLLTSERMRPILEGRVDFERFRSIFTLGKLGIGYDAVPRLGVNAFTHFLCFEIVPGLPMDNTAAAVFGDFDADIPPGEQPSFGDFPDVSFTPEPGCVSSSVEWTEVESRIWGKPGEALTWTWEMPGGLG